MRTTLTINDSIAEALKKKAYQSGKTFKEVVNETLQAGLIVKQSAKAKPYRVKPVSLGGVRLGIDLNKALKLADTLEDEEIVRKLQLRK